MRTAGHLPLLSCPIYLLHAEHQEYKGGWATEFPDFIRDLRAPRVTVLYRRGEGASCRHSCLCNTQARKLILKNHPFAVNKNRTQTTPWVPDLYILFGAIVPDVKMERAMGPNLPQLEQQSIDRELRAAYLPTGNLNCR